jgi:DNA-binding LacI/PurR family transcriptional regulator
MAPVANEFFRSIPKRRDGLLAGDRGTLVRAFTGDFGGRVRVGLSESLQEGFMYDRLRPVVEQLLQRRDIAAWVCASDTLACLCRRILDRMKVRVPDDVSLVGFDDTFQAHAAGITSYNFNRASVARAMVDFVLQPRWLHLHRGRKRVVEINGYITQRSSVRARP